jgi:hypothetical protein
MPFKEIIELIKQATLSDWLGAFLVFFLVFAWLFITP